MRVIPGFRKLVLILVLFVLACFACVHFLGAQQYRPEYFAKDLEKYQVRVTVYFLNQDDFQDAVYFYFGQRQASVLGFIAGDTVAGWIDLYMPRGPRGGIDILTLGHEFAHVLDFTAMRRGLNYPALDPDYEYGMGRMRLGWDTLYDFWYVENQARKKWRVLK